MLVHFMVPRTGLKDNSDNIKQVIAAIKEKGHTLASDWVEEAYTNLDKGTALDDQSWQTITKASFEAIARSDIVIADVSYDSTALGYQIAVAIQQKKPTLLILQEGKRVPWFTWNIPSDFLSKVEYTDTNVASKVVPFLEENDIATKDMRFNFFIDRPIYNYLRWAALKTGKTKAEILRELVQREIENKEV
jgi:nucleoside 2-deoxyribosyltransferase